MGILSIAAVVVLAAGTLTFVLLPLWRPLHSRASLLDLPRDNSTSGEVGQLDERVELIARRDTLYAAIKEAEFDRDMGKLDEVDYQTLRSRATHEAAQVLRRLDRLTPEADATFDHEIEEAVAQVRARMAGVAGTGLPTAMVETVEAEIAALVRHSGGQQDAGETACPNCGRTCPPEDAYCAHCGTRLREPVALDAERGA